MTGNVKHELNKLVLKNRYAAISFVVAFLLGMYGMFGDRSTFSPEYQLTAYELWFLSFTLSASALLKVLLPLLVAIPFADSLVREVNSNYYSFIVNRVGRHQYFLTKVNVTAVSAFLFMFLLLSLLFVVASVVSPNYVLHEQFSFRPDGAFEELFALSPALYLLLQGVLSGLTAVYYTLFGVGISAFTRNRFVVMTAPFAFFLASVIFPQFFVSSGENVFLLPFALFAPYEANSTVFAVISAHLYMIVLVSLLLWNLWRKMKD